VLYGIVEVAYVRPLFYLRVLQFDVAKSFPRSIYLSVKVGSCQNMQGEASEVSEQAISEEGRAGRGITPKGESFLNSR